jgi:hypothetical protein
MKTIILILFTIILISGCAKVYNSNNSTNQLSQIKPPDALPLVEISQEAEGMWDVTGEMLTLRLFDNGFTEFDELDMKKKVQGKQNKTDDIKIRKQFVISSEEVQEFIRLISDKDFLQLHDKYSRKCCCTDAVINYQIAFNYKNIQKKINLSGYCDDLINPDPRYLPDFPKILSELMKLNSKIRSQNSTKEFQ